MRSIARYYHPPSELYLLCSKIVSLQLVKDQYGKDFRYYKQHACAHVIPDIEDKGPPAGYSTRPGEGFRQEVKEAFNQKNFKNTDPQVVAINFLQFSHAQT
jgi:hypothetical protein